MSARGMHGLLGMLALLLLAGCAPRQVLLPALGVEPPALRDLPADFESPRSAETGQPMPGFGGGGGGVDRTPVIFIHGNTVSARYWLPVREHFAGSGYSKDELWALGYGWDNVRYFDSNDLSVPSVERIVNAVTAYLEERTGDPVPQVDVIGHSLGVTLVRQWMKQTNSWHRVRSFIGACGANDGVWTAWPDTRGQQRPVSWELAPDSPWLAQLDQGGETPGPTRYMTLYDGTGWGDVLFPRPWQDSSALEGAYNLAYNRENSTWYGHLNLPREPGPMDAMVTWLRDAPDARRKALPPDVAIADNRLEPSREGAQLHCTDDGRYPDRDTPSVKQLRMQSGKLYTCYAHDPQSLLSSPMRRYKAYTPTDFERRRPSIQASSAGGSFEHPQRVSLSSDDPEAFIVYNTAGVPLSTGSPLYRQPIEIVAPVTLSAMAVSPGGVTSEPLVLDFDISLELLEARHSLQRQFDPETPVRYEARRHKGN